MSVILHPHQCYTYQVVRQTAEHRFETLDNRRLAVLVLSRFPVKLERTRQNQEDAADAVVEVEVPGGTFSAMVVRCRFGGVGCLVGW